MAAVDESQDGSGSRSGESAPVPSAGSRDGIPPSPWGTPGPRIIDSGVTAGQTPYVWVIRGDPLPAALPLDPPAPTKPILEVATSANGDDVDGPPAGEQGVTAGSVLVGERPGDNENLPPSATGSLEIRVLGPVEVTGWIQPPERRIVAELACYLALHGDRAISADELRVALWAGEAENDASIKSLRNTVSLLRVSVGAEVFPSSSKGAGYRFAGPVFSDWGRFEQLTTDAAKARPDERGLLVEALSLIRGAPFEGVASGTFSWAWSELLVSRIEVAVVAASRRLAGLAIAAAQPDQAVWAVVQGLAVSPYDRSLWSAHLEASASQGKGALERAWRDAVAVLGSDVGDLSEVVERLRAFAR